jgi:hypothetical protein
VQQALKVRLVLLVRKDLLVRLVLLVRKVLLVQPVNSSSAEHAATRTVQAS